MHRRTYTLPALLIVAALALGACGGNAAPALTDPSQIVTKAVEAMQKAKTVHLDATVDGTLKADLTGTGSSAGVALTGTTFSADVDVANSKLHASAGVPALLGLTADIIVIGTDTYTKVSLTGDKYKKTTSPASSPTDPAQALTQIKDFLAKPQVAPTKKDDAACGSKTCYQVEIDLTADELKTLMPDQAASIGDSSVTGTLLVEKDTLYPAQVTIALKSTTIGDLTVKVTMSNWDKAVTVTAPSADQVDTTQ